jgi:uncharacterized membrane protein
VLSAIICGIWFLHLNREGCWLLFHGIPRVLVLFSILWIWLVLLVCSKMSGRFVLLAVTVALALLIPHVDGSHVAVPETRAVGRLRSLHAALQSYKAEHSKETYPATLPVAPELKVEPFYSIQYVPAHSADGKSDAFIVQATPLSQSLYCGCIRSFVINEKGELHYTAKQRAATLEDPLLQ